MLGPCTGASHQHVLDMPGVWPPDTTAAAIFYCFRGALRQQLCKVTGVYFLASDERVQRQLSMLRSGACRCITLSRLCCQQLQAVCSCRSE